MTESGVRGIDLFKIAGASISGWIPSFKTGEARPTRQPFCSQMEEQLLLYLEYHPQVARVRTRRYQFHLCFHLQDRYPFADSIHH